MIPLYVHVIVKVNDEILRQRLDKPSVGGKLQNQVYVYITLLSHVFEYENTVNVYFVLVTLFVHS